MAKMFATDPEQKPPLMRVRFLSPRQRGGVTGVTFSFEPCVLTGVLFFDRSIFN